jgi:hypothetical protein
MQKRLTRSSTRNVRNTFQCECHAVLRAILGHCLIQKQLRAASPERKELGVLLASDYVASSSHPGSLRAETCGDSTLEAGPCMESRKPGNWLKRDQIDSFEWKYFPADGRNAEKRRVRALRVMQSGLGVGLGEHTSNEPLLELATGFK